MSLVTKDFILPLRALRFDIHYKGMEEPCYRIASLGRAFSLADLERIASDSDIHGTINLRQRYFERYLRENLSKDTGNMTHLVYMKGNVFHNLPFLQYRDFGMPRKIKMSIKDDRITGVEPYSRS